MTPVLDVHVITREACELDAGAAGAVVMIPFGGTVTGTVFEGIVEPCGVDTQSSTRPASAICPPGIC